ncbi:phage protein NinX family protein [Paraburkholderia dipogonis]|uniref:phage protein NinX family protein n=1 Tax=Paraburkholderia dipogonis TaxID=1211383 RepID=UPI0038BDF45E
MYVDELKGRLLDYWVARAEGISDIRTVGETAPEYRFSSDPALATPIIERERIYIGSICDAVLGNQSIACIGQANGSRLPFSSDCFSLGDTDLEAAMRCYVSSRYGPDVA